MEGFAITGGRSGASFIGTSKGNNFYEAIKNWFKTNPNSSYDPVTMTVWGCQLFPSEAAARASFG